MKALLVLSQVTFVPRNYMQFTERLLSLAGRHFAGVLILENADRSLLKTAVGLFAFGARRFALTLARNLATSAALDRHGSAARAHGLRVLRARSVNERAVISYVRDEKIDLIVNARTRCIYRQEILDATRLGCVNIHHGLLPEYRGTMCDAFARAERRDAGFTIHRMTAKIDDGVILAKRIVSPAGEVDFLRHIARSASAEAETLAELLEVITERDSLPPGEPNSSAKVVYSKSPRTRAEVQGLIRAGLLL